MWLWLIPLTLLIGATTGRQQFLLYDKRRDGIIAVLCLIGFVMWVFGFVGYLILTEQ